MKLAAIQAALALFALATPATAQVAQEVQTGCAQPPATFNHVWTIDPVNGFTPAQYAAMKRPIPMPTIGQGPTPSTQGSAQHPWNSVQAVYGLVPGYSFPLMNTAPYRHTVLFPQIPAMTPVPYADLPGPTGPSTNNPNGGTLDPNSPIAAGDEILLMSGNHGSLSISAPSTKINNPAWPTFAAAPGQTPLLTSLFVADANRIQFIGIKAQAQAPSYMSGDVIGLGDGGGGAGLYFTGPLTTHDIVFYNMDVSNANEAVGDAWTQPQWLSNTNQVLSITGSGQTQNSRADLPNVAWDCSLRPVT
jgi:hypothetical protein